MVTFSCLEIGLSFVCGCVLLGCAAEVYYLLWWKKRKFDIQNQKPSFSSSFSCSSNYTPAHLSWWKTQESSKPTKTQENYQDPEMGMVEDLVLDDSEEESLDLELMRLHNLQGPPRFLTTINEETKEDLELQSSRKGSRTRSLSDLMVHFDTPQASPPLKGLQALNLNINPLFEIDSRGFKASPPPTFKFLRDAEEKLLKRLKELEGENGSCVKLGESKGKNGIQQNYQTAASKVLPLTCSPSNNK